MTGATFSSGVFAPVSRRAMARRLNPGMAKIAAAVVSPAVPLPTRPGQAGPEAGRALGQQALLLAGAVLLLHAWLIYYVKHRPVEPAPQLAPAPIAVELVTPPVSEPPKPLPQEKIAPPPPPPAETPHLSLPPPPPASALQPAAAPASPVVQAPAPAPSVPPPAAATPELATPATGYAGYLNNPQPAYPQFAIDQGWEGRVLLSVHVLPDGHADHVDIRRGSGHRLLDDLAAKTVLQRWVFAPARRGQTAVDGWVDVPIDFKLSN